MNVIVPTLSSFSASTNDVDQITRGRIFECVGLPGEGAGSLYSFGCGGGRGIIFSATAQIPSAQYLSDPAQSGVKFIQFGSEYRKFKTDQQRVSLLTGGVSDTDGRDLCETGRSSQDNIDSGWQLDSDQVYGVEMRFSQGNVLTNQAEDRPSRVLDRPGTDPALTYMYDAFYVETSFEMWVYYFTGSDPENPIFQRPLRLASDSSFLYHRIPWSWRGQVYYDKQLVPTVHYQLQFTTTTQGTTSASGTNSIRNYNGLLQTNQMLPCPGESYITNKKIDGTRFFVRQQFRDVLGRDPDQDGWDDWTSLITRCAFDRVCIRSRRIAVARGFLESPEVRSRNPILDNPSSTEEYNREYVRLCYVLFLRRNPEQAGWDDWTNFINGTGDYNTLVDGFISSDEYRNRPFS
ncbi:MAG: DUF4214 domain-containing protein [Pyrinomonadaceae bacterium]